ncbi:MAG: replication-associated recombination protein A [Candidatus Humimicrobiaceae bacterium]|jgi:putative ATPase|nr:replication-associated recombination protein A [Actinomycetota bacterium]MDY0028279.1 replication-associated recombination protein A [Candidatus Humimicrobiaceae bacterium]
MNLFEQIKPEQSIDNFSSIPLADRMRPKTLDEFVGQKHLVGKGKILREIIENDRLYSIIFWGPPGSGKTTLAKIIAEKTRCKFISFSAVTSGIKQIKEIMEIASYNKREHNIKTILFVDEIHRFNKAQQDAFLPFVENGTIILIGATTENPSFEVNSALLSRTKVFVLEKLSPEDIKILLKRALTDKERGLGKYNVKIDENTIDFIARFADGDSRIAYNILELAVNAYYDKNKKDPLMIDTSMIENIIQKKVLLYDKNGEEHFNLISALHKSLRDSDPDAAVYWTVRMIEAGEDPMYIIRRMVRFASEDVGLADPAALQVAISAKQSFEFIGPPEGYLAILEAAIYLALAPKSNSLYKTYLKVKSDVEEFGALPVPYHIRNAPTRLMKEMGYGRGYKYAHDYNEAIVNQNHLPDKLLSKRYYTPTSRGFENELAERLKNIDILKKKQK